MAFLKQPGELPVGGFLPFSGVPWEGSRLPSFPPCVLPSGLQLSGRQHSWPQQKASLCSGQDKSSPGAEAPPSEPLLRMCAAPHDACQQY